MSHDINRREFLKLASTSVLASSLMGCKSHRAEEKKSDGSAMTLRTNPATLDKVSLLGYGMMRLPTIGEGQDAEIDQEMVNRLVDYAIEHGVNYFDTSPAYCKGLSERATGMALKKYDRSKYFIATKLSNFSPDTWSRGASIEMFENSFRELQTDYIDYLLLHAIGIGSGMKEFRSRYIDNGILDYLVEQKQRGRIRNLGFSYHGDIKVFEQALKWHDEGKYHWDFVQIEMNYLEWEHATDIDSQNTNSKYLYDELHKRGISVIVMEPLLGGRLAKVPDYIANELKEKSPEKSIANWAFRFAGTPEGVLCVLSGMTYMEHLQDNIDTFSPLNPISEEEYQFLMGVAQDIVSLKTIPCNECNYCMPCPYGLDIPTIFAHYNKCIREGNFPNKGSQDSDYKRERRAFLIGYDRSVPKLRQADHCIACGKCVPHCPQRIPIPAEMRKINKFVEELKQN